MCLTVKHANGIIYAMTKTYITSDLHFSHKRIREFCPDTRGNFTDITHMNEEMIRMWNEIVNPEDLVYILGDVAFCSGSEAARIMARLNGRKILVKGNHDYSTLKDFNFQQSFESIHDYLEINYDGTFVVMMHYPIAEFNRMHRDNSCHFYGHLHQNKSGLEEYRIRNVGFDCTGKIVTLMEDAIADAMTGKIKGHH